MPAVLPGRFRARAAVRRGAPAASRRIHTQSAASVLAVAVTCSVASALGCRSSVQAESLETRVRQYLELKQRHEWPAIYDGLLDPEARKTIDRTAFLKKRSLPFDVLGYELVSTKVDGERATVTAKLDAMIPVLNPRGGTVMMRKQLEDPQEWVSRDGHWYIHLEG